MNQSEGCVAHRLYDRLSPLYLFHHFAHTAVLSTPIPLPSDTCFRHQPRSNLEPHCRNLPSGDFPRLRPLSLSNPFFLFPLPHIAPSISFLDLQSDISYLILISDLASDFASDLASDQNCSSPSCQAVRLGSLNHRPRPHDFDIVTGGRPGLLLLY